MKKIILALVIFGCAKAPVVMKNYRPSEADVKKAKEIAVETAKWFSYNAEAQKSEREGQCGDYALRFILKFNEYVGKNVARLVVANNPIPSGTYIVGEKVDVKAQGFNGFASGGSGFLSWDGVLYVYHPINGAYTITLEKEWIPKKHFGVDMLDKRQVHTWASIGDISVDPTYYDTWPKDFPSPLGKDI